MKKIKQLKGWHICSLSPKEKEKYGFTHAVIHPDVVGTGNITAEDTDMECYSMEEALLWIMNY